MNDHTKLTEKERMFLDEVENLMAGGGSEMNEPDSLIGFCAHLANTIPDAPPGFKQRLEDQLMTQWQERFGVLHNAALLPDQSANVFTLLPRQWIRGVDGHQQSLKKIKWRTIKKPLMYVSGVILIVAVLMVAFIPSVQAVVFATIQSVVLSPYSSVSQIPKPVEGLIKTSNGEIGWLIKTDIGNFGGDVFPGSDPSVRSVNSFEEAQALTSFHLLSPAYLPEGYFLREVKLTPFNEWTLLFYSGPQNDIIIVQMPVGRLPGDDPNVVQSIASGIVTEGSLEEIDFDGQKAAWVDGHTLIWESDSIAFNIGGLDLSLQGTMEIARSLR